MKMSKLAIAFVPFVCLITYLAYTKWHQDFKPDAHVNIVENGESKLYYPALRKLDHGVFYGIMFDAGSTGTRIHIFRFTQMSKETPKLAHETFKALKPGLSAYADDPDKCTRGIQELLEVAKEEIPEELWKATPLVLKATAGLRLLPGEKAQKLLDKVKEAFQSSPFFVRDDCATIMNGTDEGISSWITVNFLTDSLNNSGKKRVGMLDLGGGSTQISFYPNSEKTLQTSLPGYITSFQMFNMTYKLYSFSYLGLGLMSARLSILGGTEGQHLNEGEEFITPCFTPDFRYKWEHAEITYRIKGQKAGEPMYESCFNKVAKMLYKKVHKAEEIVDVDFYAFSYYYDRAAEVNLIDLEEGGSLKLEDFENAAKYTCKTMENVPSENPFLCMDLTYISTLLQELGFPKSKVLKLARKINNVETSWALGATFHYIDSLNGIQH
ncbi:ectonucleoside triphosphate diphosphohydrolase 6 [Microcaecilia unicolor]|uniref:nucleoside diphosphate phosphatase n=1 Tax=Microcaecilia unicolor TaxID=1415580 RepID=A0A6P7XNY6_9AMPH|nr:ectonucleoside triphosphate diphosphohydrolase 6 [Microcaecilia unicolor]XP_030052134.1 ectonucleoside triphosphate diphosphohydrolase 6 [Microcaecilia unicolor]XP_030052135.1 ectonucleoside triphosphate diphosphohydrolase 6 [Microcaecilia unicolor]